MKVRVLAICLFAVWLSISALAGEFQINTHTTNNQADAAIAIDSNDNFVVVWSSYAQDSNSGGVFGQRFDADANPLGNEFQINVEVIGNQTDPAVAADATGNFVVTWHGPGVNDIDIFARRYDANGQPLGSEFRVNTTTFSIQRYPNIAMNNSGSFVIVWESEMLGGVPEDAWKIHGQLYDSNGTAVGSEFDPNSRLQARYPDVAIDDSGSFAVTWMWDIISKTNNLIMVQQFNADTTPKADPFEVNTSTFTTVTRPLIAMNGNGHFVIAWYSHPDAADLKDIRARRYLFDGTALTDEFVVNTTLAGEQTHPAAAINDNLQFIILWDSETEPNTNIRDIRGQRYDEFYMPIGGEFLADTYIANDQKYPDVVITEDGEFIAVWQSAQQDGSGFGIFGQAGPVIGSADFSDDGFVDFADYCRLAQEWLHDGSSLATDIVDDDIIDSLDLQGLSQQWLLPCYPCSQADINTDYKIDFKDYAHIAIDWQKEGPLAGDITKDGYVNTNDLRAIALNWAGQCQREYSCSDVDIYSDSQVDFKDYANLTKNWLQQGPNLAGDINDDGSVDWADLEILLTHWTNPCL